MVLESHWMSNAKNKKKSVVTQRRGIMASFGPLAKLQITRSKFTMVSLRIWLQDKEHLKKTSCSFATLLFSKWGKLTLRQLTIAILSRHFASCHSMQTPRLCNGSAAREGDNGYSKRPQVHEKDQPRSWSSEICSFENPESRRNNHISEYVVPFMPQRSSKNSPSASRIFFLLRHLTAFAPLRVASLRPSRRSCLAPMKPIANMSSC